MSPSFTLFKLTMLINLLGLFAYLVHDPICNVIFSICLPSLIRKHTRCSIKRVNTRKLHYIFEIMTKSQTHRLKYKLYS